MLSSPYAPPSTPSPELTAEDPPRLDHQVSSLVVDVISGTRVWLIISAIAILLFSLFLILAAIGFSMGNGEGHNTANWVIVSLTLTSAALLTTSAVKIFQYYSAINRLRASLLQKDLIAALKHQKLYWITATLGGAFGLAFFSVLIIFQLS